MNLATSAPLLQVRDGERVMVDLGDTIIEVHGHQRQGAGFGYSGVRGLNALITTRHHRPITPARSTQRASVDRGKILPEHDNELVRSRPDGTITFSNGAKASFDYDIAIELEEIAELTCVQVIADITRSVEEQNASSSGPQALYVQMQGADRRFGIDLGYSRFTPHGSKDGRDSFSLELDTGAMSYRRYQAGLG